MIYADFNGSAPLAPKVKEYLLNRINVGPFANPNAIHYLGTQTLMMLENARKTCAKALGAHPSQVFFNSGATEGIATVIHSIIKENPDKKTIVTSGIEHSCIHNLNSYFQQLGYKIITTPTTHHGYVDLDVLKEILLNHQDDIALVTVMAANNETGVLQAFKEINQFCKQLNLKYFCDTTQIIGKIPFNFEQSELDYAVCSGHKLGALTGTGIMLIKNPLQLTPLLIGGGQEKGLRGGTQNYLGNETLAIALSECEKKFQRLPELEKMRVNFETEIKKQFPEVVIFGEGAPRLATTTYITYPGLHGQAVQIELESQDIFVTTSSACSDNLPVTSKVLKSMNVSDELGRGVVRISLGLCATEEMYQQILTALSKAYEKLSRVKSY